MAKKRTPAAYEKVLQARHEKTTRSTEILTRLYDLSETLGAQQSMIQSLPLQEMTEAIEGMRTTMVGREYSGELAALEQGLAQLSDRLETQRRTLSASLESVAQAIANLPPVDIPEIPVDGLRDDMRTEIASLYERLAQRIQSMDNGLQLPPLEMHVTGRDENGDIDTVQIGALH